VGLKPTAAIASSLREEEVAVRCHSSKVTPTHHHVVEACHCFAGASTILGMIYRRLQPLCPSLAFALTLAVVLITTPG